MATQNFLVFTQNATGGKLPAGAAPAVEGETTDNTFAQMKAVEITGFQFGVENPTTLGTTASGAGMGKAKFQDFQVAKLVDKASAPLFLACAAGAHFDQVDLYIRKHGQAAQAGGNTGGTYLRYTFKLVYVTTISWAGGTATATGGADLPEETIEFAYGALAISYYVQKPDGTFTSQPSSATWNQVTNSASLVMPG